MFGLAIAAKEKKDEVKLTAAIAKIIEEDPSISLSHSQDMGEMVLWGQGEMHLRVALEKLVRKYGIDAVDEAAADPLQGDHPQTDARCAAATRSSRAVTASSATWSSTIKPQPRGEGFEFSDQITGGVVPKNYIPSVEIGVRDYLHHGPLGFNVVDVAVCLIDGSYHSVDSSDMAFRQAGRIAMSEGMPQCSPGAARAGDGGRDRRSVRSDRQDQRHHLVASRADPRLRRAPWVAGMGPGAGADARRPRSRI